VPLDHLLPDKESGSVPPVRTEPVQGRSAARVDALLDAVASVVDEIGFERLTTAMVSERAEASIGTVYRYFPDRIALLQGLRDRAAQRFRTRVIELIDETKPEHWWDAVDCALDAFTQMYRREPGFRIIRFADTERITGDQDSPYQPEFFAARFGDILAEEFGLPSGDELTFHLNIGVQIGDALITRAFQVSPDGDEKIIAEARSVVRGYLAGYYGDESLE
jgi:AcrR family transcriptional regulator